MTITRTELLSEVLEDIGVLAIGENASAEDNAKVLSKYKFIHAYLQKNDLLPFDDDDPIPEEYVQPLVFATGAAVSMAYGIQSDMNGAIELAEAMIHKINKDYTGVQPTRFDDF